MRWRTVGASFAAGDSRTVENENGAFNCAPKPTTQLVCAEGLVYFERDGMIGCRMDRRSQ